MNYIDHTPHRIGKAISPGGRIRVVFHPTFMWYFDGEDSTTIVAILFPDGTEWFLS